MPDVTVQQSPEEQAPVSVADTSNVTALPQEVAQKRASRAYFGLKNVVPKSFDEMYTDIQSGNEPALRQQAAANLDQQKAAQASNMISMATTKGIPLTVGDIQTARDYVNNKTDPDTVLESRWSRQYMSALNWPMEDPNTSSNYKDALREIPEHVHSTVESGRSLLTISQSIDTLLEENEANRQNQSTLGAGFDFLKGQVPFFNEAQLRGLVEGVGRLQGGPLGNNLQAQADHIFSQTPEDANKILRTAFDYLKSNPQLAGYWLSSIRGMSTSDRVMANVGTYVDLSNIKPLAALGVAKRAFMNNAATAAARQMVKDAASATERGAAQTAAAASGNLERAGVIQAATDLTHAIAGQTNPFEEIANSVPSVLKNTAEKIGQSPGNFGTESANRLKEWMDNNTSKLMQLISTNARLTRRPEIETVPEVTQAIHKEIREDYVGLSNNILDLGNVRKDPYSTSFFVPVTLGHNTASSFAFIDQARAFIKYHGLGKIATIEGSDLPTTAIDTHAVTNVAKPSPAYTVKIWLPVRENGAVRDLLAKTENTKAPMGFWNSLVGWARSPEDTQAMQEMINRKVATYATASIKDWMRSVAKDISPVAKNKQLSEDMTRIINLNKNTGKWAESPLELDGLYQQHLGRSVSADETRAYFAHKYMTEAANVFNNLTAYKNATSRGVMSHTVWYHDEAGNKVPKTFDGIVRGELPRGQGTVMFMGNDLNSMHVERKGSQLGERGKAADEAIKTGGQKVIEVWNPEQYPFRDYGKVEPDHRVKYVVTNNLETDNLKFNQIPVQPGGYIDHDYEWSIKQAVIHHEGDVLTGWRHYDGDSILMHGHSPAMLKDINDKFEKIREHLRNGREVEAEQEARGLPLPWQDVRNKFFETTTPTTKPIGDVKESVGLTKSVAEKQRTLGRIQAALKDMGNDPSPSLLKQEQMMKEALQRDLEKLEGLQQGTPITKKPSFSLSEPFVVAPRRKMLIDIPNNGIKERAGGDNYFRDGTKIGSARIEANNEFLQGRDAEEIFSMRNKGSRQNPVYQLEPAQHVDPMTVLNRALNRAIDSLFMDDYKIYSVENWVAQARDAGALREQWAGDIKNNPYKHFNDPDYVKGLDPRTQTQLENQRQQIKAFLGIPSKTGQILQSWSQHMADSIYTKWNPDQYGPIARTFLLTPPWLLANLTKPLDIMRSIAFHATMGFWSPVPLFVWSANYATVLGIAGIKKAGPGLMGAILHQLGRVNNTPEWIDHLDKMISRMGMMKPGDFKIARDALHASGFDRVGENYSFLPELSNKVFQSGTQKFLDFGLFFFKAADRNLHYSAWYTAFKEFRDLNPTGALSSSDIGWILNRADLLATNMSNASKSNLQRGIFAPAAQFTSFTLRLWEQAAGRRLTKVERVRLLGTYAALFGIPGAAGLAGGPIPAGEMIRKWAIDNGYFPGASNQQGWETPFMEGGISMLGHLATGEYYNVGQRFGFEGIFNSDVLRDKSIWDWVGGASFSTMSNVAASSSGFWNMLQSGIRRDGKFKPELEHFLSIAENINSLKNVNRGIIAYNTGRWVSLNGSYITSVTPGQALLKSITGLKTQEEADVATMHWSMEEQRQAWRVAETHFTTEWRRGLEAMRNKDSEQANTYFNNAFYYLEVTGYPRMQWQDVARSASNDWEDTISKTQWDYYSVNKNIPEDASKMRHDLYQQILQSKAQK